MGERELAFENVEGGQADDIGAQVDETRKGPTEGRIGDEPAGVLAQSLLETAQASDRRGRPGKHAGSGRANGQELTHAGDPKTGEQVPPPGPNLRDGAQTTRPSDGAVTPTEHNLVEDAHSSPSYNNTALDAAAVTPTEY